jgi:hypothetical protein
MFEDVRLDIAEAYRRLTEAPEEVEVRDVDLMSACLYADQFVESMPVSRTAATDGPQGGPLERKQRDAKDANRAQGEAQGEAQGLAQGADGGEVSGGHAKGAKRPRGGKRKVDLWAQRSGVDLEAPGESRRQLLSGQRLLLRNATGLSAGPSAGLSARRRLPKSPRYTPNAGVGRVWRARGIPGPPGGSPPNEYVFFLNKEVGNETVPSGDEVAEAKARLRSDFVVGLTEQMPSFLVLMALELGWSLDRLCCIARNVNTATGGHKSRLAPAIFAHAEVKLAPDMAVYAEAERIHAEQVAAFQPLHARALKSFTDPAFGQIVCKHDVAGGADR